MTRRFTPILAPLAIGLVLACASHPMVAGLIVSGESRRPLTIGRLVDLAMAHVALAGTGLAIVAVLGVGLGILVTRGFASGLRGGVDAIAAIAQGLPPMVVVALALPVVGFGGPPTLLALVAYGVMPTLRGTVGAIEAVSLEAKEAARAIGLTPGQILRHVELPLAGDGILDALRIALVLSIATAAVGALAGASTLGTPIVAGLQNQNLLPMVQGASATAALAFLCDAGMLALAAMLGRAR